MAQMLAGKYNDSIKSFKKAYEKDIALQESLYNISVAYDMKGDKLNSIIYYKKYIKAKEKKDDDIF
jgi:tetratricopeptide (TPR) repeat protein